MIVGMSSSACVGCSSRSSPTASAAFCRAVRPARVPAVSSSSPSSSSGVPKKALALAAGALAALSLEQAPLAIHAARADSSEPVVTAEKKAKAEALKAALKEQYSIVTAEETSKKSFLTTSAPPPKATFSKGSGAKKGEAPAPAVNTGEGPDARLILAFAVLFAPLGFPFLDALKNSVLLVKKLFTTGEGLY